MPVISHHIFDNTFYYCLYLHSFYAICHAFHWYNLHPSLFRCCIAVHPPRLSIKFCKRMAKRYPHYRNRIANWICWSHSHYLSKTSQILSHLSCPQNRQNRILAKLLPLHLYLAIFTPFLEYSSSECASVDYLPQ